MFTAHRRSLPSGEASRTFHLHRLMRGRDCRDSAHLMRIRSRGKCSGSKISFYIHGNGSLRLQEFFFLLCLSSSTGINLQVLKGGLRQRYETRRSGAGATVSAGQAPRMCHCLPPLKLSNWICARRGSGWNDWVTAGSTPASQITVARKTAAAEKRRWRQGPAAAARRVQGNRRNSKKVNNF